MIEKRKREYFKHQVTRAFDNAVDTYDQYGNFQRTVAETLASMIVAEQDRQCSSGLKVMEIGCGTGFLTMPLSKAFPFSFYCATDRSLQMTKKCQMKMGRSLPVFVMDGEQFSITGDWDWIVSSLVVQWFQNLKDSLRQQSMVGKNIAFTTLVEGTFQEWTDICHQLEIPVNVNAFMGIDELKQICEDVFLSNFKIAVYSHTETFESISDFLKNLKKLGAQTPLLFLPQSKFFLRKIIQEASRPFRVTYEVAYVIGNTPNL